MIIGSKMYDILKPIASIVLPAAAALYLALGNVWNWPNLEEVAASVAAINVFLGAILGLSSKAYNNADPNDVAGKYDGSMLVSEKEGGGLLYSLELNNDAERLAEKKDLILKIVA